MQSQPEIAAHEEGLPGWAVPLVFLFFFVSGLSGLVYEVLWTRMLLTVFGATLYAVATVLAAFMGGLALGSFLGGRVADRTGRCLRLYGALELVVTLAALAVPLLLRAFDPVYRAVYEGGGEGLWALNLLRFGLSFIVLMLPTTCMGATLPVLSRFLLRRGGSLGGRVGGLYAINTSGAVGGVFLAGFFLLAHFGLDGTLYVAAALSGGVGLAALVLSLAVEKVPQETATADEEPAYPEDGIELPPWLVRLVLGSYALSGFIALSYQVFWTRALVFRFEILKNTTYSFSAMLTVFLVGLAAGSALMSALVRRQRDPVRLYGLLQLLTGISGAFSLYVLLRVAGNLQIADPITDSGQFVWSIAVGNVFLRTAATILLPTLLMGMAFPVAARVCVRHLETVGRGTGRLYALNTVGAIAGSFAAGFLLIPWLGLAQGLLVLGFGNIAIGLAVLMLEPGRPTQARLGWAGLGLVIAVVFAVSSPGETPFQDVPPRSHIVVDEAGETAYIEGPLSTASVLENSLGYRTIYVDNVGVAGTDRVLLTDQKSLAHVPMLILENPRKALTVGFGSGGASWSFLQYEELERLDCIEIDATVPRLHHVLRESNHGVLDEWDRESSLRGQTFHGGRYRIVIDDARSFLRFSPERYDVIATDCTDLRYKTNANLYDVQYFELCRESITEQGMVVVWMPLGGMSPEVFACAMRSFSHVFPDMTVWFMHNEPTHYLLLLGTRRPLEIRLDRMLERIARPAVRADLAEVSLHQPEKILACFLTEAPAIEQHLRDINPVLNTEHTPYLEFESPKYGINDAPLITNLEILRERRRPVTPYIADADAHPEFMQRLGRFTAAVDDIILGHHYYRRIDLAQATERYLAARATCPEDDSLEHLLEYTELRRRIARNPRDSWALTALGEVLAQQGRYEEAAGFLDRALAPYPPRAAGEDPVLARAVVALGRCYLGLERPAAGRRFIEEYRAALEGNAEFEQLRRALAP